MTNNNFQDFLRRQKKKKQFYLATYVLLRLVLISTLRSLLASCDTKRGDFWTHFELYKIGFVIFLTASRSRSFKRIIMTFFNGEQAAK
jgi:hypothetical protein